MSGFFCGCQLQVSESKVSEGKVNESKVNEGKVPSRVVCW